MNPFLAAALGAAAALLLNPEWVKAWACLAATLAIAAGIPGKS